MTEPDPPTVAPATNPPPAPVARWLRRTPPLTFALVVLAAVVVVVALCVIVNPGNRVGPVRPASPPVPEAGS